MKKVILTKAGNENTTVKILPCRIDYSGPANTEDYLPEEDCGSLYGRKLNGATIPMPDGLIGNIIEVRQLPDTKELTSIAEFNNIQYWNYDQPADKNDQLPQLLNYIEILSSLHNA
ncbi:unnamed protein product [Blepharisma stoltei]|uniref:Uncharacterized protein n=1 Tax=Blepharisma stoltei TaxID=1481888 RepID=A0AAU9JLY0_9CILI|nr:unnamed protein product [Blepharisma stoltei]